MINVTLKGGVVKQFDGAISVLDVAKSIGAGLFKAACACKIDGELCDLRTTVTADCTLEIITFDETAGKKAFWHTASHILAQAIKRLYPQTKLTIGPSIDTGFYYDFDVETPFTAENLEKIEAEMKKIVKEGQVLERFTLPAKEAIKLMEERGEPYKIELINEHAGKGEDISFYKQGEFVDLCAGPHLYSTEPIKAIKLTQCTGAYWRGDANNRQLCRVYGVAFPKQAMLEEHLARIEEAKRRDHRKLGRELDLFDIYDEGPGFPFFLPNGMILRNELESYWHGIHNEYGYEEIKTPIMLNEELWHTSGHYDHYKDNMYFTTIDETPFAMKPMNCPGGMLVYKRRPHSYRELPIRTAELGLVHRHELSGALHGLMRVRCFTQDDAHIFMTPEQIETEILKVMELINRVYNLFGFNYKVELSTRPKDSMGSDADWEKATNALKKALEISGREYVINEGDGAFYGPKIDFHLEDCIGRTWQCGTIQLDFQMPERFDLTYVGSDGEKHRPIMIHRVAFGSIERFIAILTEHFAGAFPTWLSPVQARILPISDKHNEYAQSVLTALQKAGVRAEMDTRSEKVGFKIREAQMQKIPYMLIIGDKEVEDGAVAVRARKQGDMGAMPASDFTKLITQEIAARAL